jgi:hypothetical protein
MNRARHFAAAAAALVLLAGCKTAGEGETTATTGDDGATVEGSGSVDGGGTSDGGTGTGTSIPALVSVNLQNVLNDLSVSLNVEEANIPVNAQVPIEVAANVCGVSVNALGASIASGQAGGCTATTTSPELIQVVQQQISAGGDVEGGDQTTTVPDTNLM